MNIPYAFKRCTKCGKWLVASSEYFYKKKTGKYGLRADCKECRKKYGKKYREENKEAIAEHGKKYREANKEAIAEYKKKYYEANKQAILEQCKEYREQNKEAITEYKKKHYKANKEAKAERYKKYYDANKEAFAERGKKYRQTPQGQVVRFNSHNRRRAKKQNQGSGVTKGQWLEMMNFFEFRCAYSGKYIGGDSKDRTIDHIEPLNNGGENEIWNCIPMDRSLNSSKHDKDMLEWYTKQPFYSHERLLKILEWQEYAKNKF